LNKNLTRALEIIREHDANPIGSLLGKVRSEFGISLHFARQLVSSARAVEGVPPAALANIREQAEAKKMKPGIKVSHGKSQATVRVTRQDTTFVIPDLHIPYHLQAETDAYLRFGYSINPARVVLLGDVIDAMAISRFDKNPARKTTLAGEIDIAKRFLKDLRDRFPLCDIHYCEGNHEDRLRKFLWKRAPELADIRGMSIPDLLGLSDLGIQWHSSSLRVGQLTYTHANRIRRLAGQTARAMSDEWNSSVICGHSHRQGWCPRTTPTGVQDGYEAGCLCDYRRLDYVDNVPNWQIGGATVETFPDGTFTVDFARFVDSGKRRCLVWRGRRVGELASRSQGA